MFRSTRSAMRNLANESIGISDTMYQASKRLAI